MKRKEFTDLEKAIKAIVGLDLLGEEFVLETKEKPVTVGIRYGVPVIERQKVYVVKRGTD